MIDTQIANRPSLPQFLQNKINHFYQDTVSRRWGGKMITHGTSPKIGAVNVFSNDYLCVCSDNRYHEYYSRRSQEEHRLMMSAVFFSEDDIQSQVENSYAQFLHAEATVICQSGWAANTGLIQVLGEGVPVYIDFNAHMSLYEGVHCARSKAYRFRHNSVEHLERLLQRYGAGVIVVDSVYSTNGSIAPLLDLVRLAETYESVLVVDESHSLGTHGPYGKGLVVGLGLENRVHFRTASLAKAFGGRAGIITCSEAFAEVFRFTSLPAIFSSALVPSDLRALEKTIALIASYEDRRRRLHQNHRYLREGLTDIGYNVLAGQSQIVSLESGLERTTIRLRDTLDHHGIHGAIFAAPVTPLNHSKVRLTVHSELEQKDLNRIIEVCDRIKDQVGFYSWKSTKEMRQKSQFVKEEELCCAAG